MVQTKEERKAKRKEYSLRPEVKAKRKEFADRPEVKAKRKEYRERPEVKAKRKAYSKVYLEKPEVKAKRKSYDSRPGKKAKTQEYNAKPETKARKKEYSLRPEIKAKAKEYRDRPENRTRIIDSHQKIRSNVLQKYSKRLSNSNVPCCRCCGINVHVNFLAIDHIAGKKQMDSEPELVKLGYSSTMQTNTLQRWIIENKFPKGFQILCHNCNKAKANPINNNECPMKNKPH